MPQRFLGLAKVGGANWLTHSLWGGGGDTKSPCKSYTDKNGTKTKNGKDQVTKWCMERLFENLGLVKSLDPNRGDYYSTPYKSLVAMPNRLTHVGLWPRAMKLNPSWKTEVSKNAWMKPCITS